ncbi:MAG: hypothetical protein LBF44_02730, partial [Holosporaceae bacterium]|nr:hypothetical protein [Holosporaceae bacterium]
RGDLESVEKTRRIFITISIIFGGVIAIPLAIYPEWIFKILSLFPDDISYLYVDIRIVLYLVALDVTLETLLLSHWGILIAGGDSKYAAMIYQICLWIFIVFPTIALYYLRALTSIPILFVFTAMWLVATQFFLYRRYKSLKWYNRLV